MARSAGVRTDISLDASNPTRVGTTPTKKLHYCKNCAQRQQ